MLSVSSSFFTKTTTGRGRALTPSADLWAPDWQQLFGLDGFNRLPRQASAHGHKRQATRAELHLKATAELFQVCTALFLLFSVFSWVNCPSSFKNAFNDVKFLLGNAGVISAERFKSSFKKRGISFNIYVTKWRICSQKRCHLVDSVDHLLMSLEQLNRYNSWASIQDSSHIRAVKTHSFQISAIYKNISTNPNQLWLLWLWMSWVWRWICRASSIHCTLTIITWLAQACSC